MVENPLEENSSIPENAPSIEWALSETPTLGSPVEIREGLWLVRLPLDGPQDHVNVYIVEEEYGFSLVDTGSNLTDTRSILSNLFLRSTTLPVQFGRVLVTHYHPDHVGLAGHWAEQGAELWMSQTCWLQTKVLLGEHRDLPNEEQIAFVRSAGLSGVAMASYCRHAPSNYGNLVCPLPFSYRRMRDGETLQLGSNRWQVRMGHGHASEHATLWSDHGVAITGDQILSGISTNLSVHPSEPQADLVTDWVASCLRFSKETSDDTLCLPGHGLPFFGAATRCKQMIANLERTLNRLLESLSKPRCIVDMLETVYRRKLQGSELQLSIAETVGFMNHLEKKGLVRKIEGAGVHLWLRTPNHQSVSFSSEPSRPLV